MAWTAHVTPDSQGTGATRDNPGEEFYMANPNTRQTNIPGFDIPTHDHIATTYHGATNNLATVVYRLGGAAGTLVATLTFTYVGGVPVVDDARLSTVVKS